MLVSSPVTRLVEAKREDIEEKTKIRRETLEVEKMRATSMKEMTGVFKTALGKFYHPWF